MAFKIFHADHGITPEQMAFVQSTLLDSAPQGFFIREIWLPVALGPVPNALWGPASGDAPVSETDVFYLDRGGRGLQDRMTNLPPRPTQQVQSIGIRDGDEFTLFTVYGGPLAPQHPDDPNNQDPSASRAWWAQHALSAQQWAQPNTGRGALKHFRHSSFKVSLDHVVLRARAVRDAAQRLAREAAGDYASAAAHVQAMGDRADSYDQVALTRLRLAVRDTNEAARQCVSESEWAINADDFREAMTYLTRAQDVYERVRAAADRALDARRIITLRSDAYDIK